MVVVEVTVVVCISGSSSVEIHTQSHDYLNPDG